MSWLETLLARGSEASGKGSEPPQVPAPRRPRPEAVRFWFQTAAAVPEIGDPGAAEMGCYYLEDGAVVMCNEAGKETGARHFLEPGQDPRPIAGFLARKAWSDSDRSAGFWRRLDYPR